jgi:hypothetical protein
LLLKWDALDVWVFLIRSVMCDIIADQGEVSKFADWAADTEFADYSVWSNAQNARAA